MWFVDTTGLCFYDLKHYEEALDSFNQVIELEDNNDDGEDFNNKGKCLYRLKRYDEVCPHLIEFNSQFVCFQELKNEKKLSNHSRGFF